MSDSLRTPLPTLQWPLCCLMHHMERLKHFHSTTVWRGFHTIKRGTQSWHERQSGPADNTSRERASKDTNERGTVQEAPGETVPQNKKTAVPLEPRTSDQIPGGEARLKNVWWVFLQFTLWSLSELDVFQTSSHFIAMTTTLSDDANQWQLVVSLTGLLSYVHWPRRQQEALNEVRERYYRMLEKGDV